MRGTTRPGAASAKRAGGLAYRRTGHGEPLVLLHGLGASGGIWSPVLPFLEAHRDVIAVDLPGFGESAPLAGRSRHTPGELAAAVERLMKALNMDSPQVAGHSLGGWVALELAVRGCAGSVTTVAAVSLGFGAYDAERIHLSRISAADVAAVTARLLAMTRAERAALPVMHPGRVDVIGAGALVLRTLVDRFGLEDVVVSEADILDGIAWSVT